MSIATEHTAAQAAALFLSLESVRSVHTVRPRAGAVDVTWVAEAATDRGRYQATMPDRYPGKAKVHWDRRLPSLPASSAPRVDRGLDGLGTLEGLQLHNAIQERREDTAFVPVVSAAQVGGVL